MSEIFLCLISINSPTRFARRGINIFNRNFQSSFYHPKLFQSRRSFLCYTKKCDYLLWRFDSGRISGIGRRFLAAGAVRGRPTTALLRLRAVLQVLLLLHQKTLLLFRRDFEFSICAPGLTNDGSGYHVGEVLVGLDAVHVLVQDRDLLFVVPSGGTKNLKQKWWKHC